MKIAVFGGLGKLGSAIIENLKDLYDFAVFDSKNGNANCNFADFDLVIDASTHQNSVVLAKACMLAKTPLLVCATGHTKKELLALEKLKKQTKIEICPNLSRGVNTIVEWLENARFDNCKISIFERHHTQKKDSPSGTALWLKKAANKIDCSPEIVSSRFGDDVGTHVITLDMPHEQITIIHKAKDRLVFALGAKYKIENLLRENSDHEN